MDQDWTETRDVTSTTDFGDAEEQITCRLDELTGTGTCEEDKPTLGDATIVNVPVKVR